MDNIKKYELFLKTAFSCLACDGEIDKREVNLISKIHREKKIFGEIDLKERLNDFVKEINNEGFNFLKKYLKELNEAKLNENDELILIEIAIQTIKADDEIKYSEVKFFKLIRSKLNIKDEDILKKHPDLEEYLEQDVFSPSYLEKIDSDYFNIEKLKNIEIESFKPILKIDEDESEKE